jgi:hypothetical protein
LLTNETPEAHRPRSRSSTGVPETGAIRLPHLRPECRRLVRSSAAVSLPAVTHNFGKSGA